MAGNIGYVRTSKSDRDRIQSQAMAHSHWLSVTCLLTWFCPGLLSVLPDSNRTLLRIRLRCLPKRQSECGIPWLEGGAR